MYSTCLFCHTDLGVNRVVERLPIGRRLAFDASKGRLWVVCGQCERWNLTPIEERWEAIEACERMFRGTYLRVSTDNIGLARLREGLELVRIGPALRPEIAAWRYGDQFGKRRRRQVLTVAGGGALAVGAMVVPWATGILATSGTLLYQAANWAYISWDLRRPRAHVVLPGYERPVVLRRDHLAVTAIERDGEGWRLRVVFDAASGAAPGTSVVNPGPSIPWYSKESFVDSAPTANAALSGSDALRVAGQLLPLLNAAGAGKRGVGNAVRVVEETPDTEKLFRRALPNASEGGGPGTQIRLLPVHVRLALEMAAHEESERRAFDGELAQLEAAWRQAEEIAAISDALLTPAEIDQRLRALKTRD